MRGQETGGADKKRNAFDSSIFPMRGQESRDGRYASGCLRINFPHEGSGDAQGWRRCDAGDINFPHEGSGALPRFRALIQQSYQFSP